MLKSIPGRGDRKCKGPEAGVFGCEGTAGAQAEEGKLEVSWSPDFGIDSWEPLAAGGPSSYLVQRLPL